MSGVLSTGGADPCSLLNTTSYPTLFISTATTGAEYRMFGYVSTAGVPKTFLSSVNSSNIDLTKTVLATVDATSKSRLISFLSGSGVGGKNAVMLEASGNSVVIDYMKVKDVLLSSDAGGKTYQSIIDTYIAPIAGETGKYTYSTPQKQLIPDTALYVQTDVDTSGNVVGSPASVVGKLINQGFLLKRDEVYRASDFTSTPNTNESLVYLYKQEQVSKVGLTANQKLRKTLLEARNLRFFSAYIIEYCYYRTRYQWLLTTYFSIYTKPIAGSTTGYTSPTQSASQSPIVNLFTGVGTGETQYTPGTGTEPFLSQADYLKGLAYQMACLNTRMADMRRVLDYVNQYYSVVYSSLQTTLNADPASFGSNKMLTEVVTTLQSSADSANAYLTEQDFRQGIMEYTSEKNRYSNILLGLYAFLNISALVVVFNVLRQ